MHFRVQVMFKKLDPEVQLPAFKSGGASGMDLRAHFTESSPVILEPGEIAIIPTGLAMAMAPGVEAQVRPRSGLATKGVTVVNAPGTIDADYRGEIKVILINLGKESQKISHGDRIAQLVIQMVPEVDVEEADELPDTERGSGGFGSTGSR